MSENNDMNTQQDPAQQPAQSQSPAATQPTPPPAPANRSVMSASVSPQQPAPPTQPASPVSEDDSQQVPQQNGEGQPQGSAQQGQQNQQAPNQRSQDERPKPTFRENGAFSFFATPSDPDDDPAPMSWGFKIGWFVLGLIGGMLGLVMAFISTTTLSPKRRRQALFATWIGFACQAVLFLVMTLTGTSIPFLPGGTATQTATTAGTGSSSAFG